MRSTFLDTTALSQPLPTPPGLRDARQMAHLSELASVEKTLRQLPRFGATYLAQGLMLRANVLLQLSTMTEDEEKAYLADGADEPEVVLSSKRGSISSTFPDGRIAFKGTYDCLKITEAGPRETRDRGAGR